MAATKITFDWDDPQFRVLLVDYLTKRFPSTDVPVFTIMVMPNTGNHFVAGTVKITVTLNAVL
jgi:hypothetical protein